MSFWDLIFGKGSGKTVTKAANLVMGSQRRATQKSPPSDPKRPKVKWGKSENGHDQAEIDGFRVTIFKKGARWNYCVVEILDEIDLEDGEVEDPVFGDWYDTKAEARAEAFFELGYE